MQESINKFVFVGLMGAGKTRIGYEFAKNQGIRFVDLDREIESAAGCSIADIFDRYGEQAFRDGESKVLSRLLVDDLEPLILATGGGAFMKEENRRCIAENSTSIWLKADIDLLVERTSRTNHRPLLNNGNPKQILENLIEARYPIYELSDIVIDVKDVTPKTMVRNIIKAIDEYMAVTK